VAASFLIAANSTPGCLRSEPNRARAHPRRGGGLRKVSNDFQGDTFPAYGAAIGEVVADEALGREWLEAAVVAGHVPYFDGIVTAVRAEFAYTLMLVAEDKSRGMLYEAIGWTEMRSSYRELADLLRSQAERLDELAEQLRTAEG
jgi:hypothetical protein